MDLETRHARPDDERAISDLVRAAFGDEEGPEIAELVVDLCGDPTARPLLSLVAVSGSEIVGHILFTRVTIEPDHLATRASILCPLAVHPAHQDRGVGGRLIEEGLAALEADETALVFVLGHPGYYPRFGFTPAGVHGFEAHFPIPPDRAAAWMVRALQPGAIESHAGRVVCADALDDPKHW